MTLRLRSLRVRLLLISAGIVVIALLVTGAGLTKMFERHSERRVAEELNIYLDQLSGAVRWGPDQRLSLTRDLADPRFKKVFSGLYWQIGNDQNGALLRSRSLWDSELILPDDPLAAGDIHQHNIESPFSRALLVREQLITISFEGKLIHLRVSVAIDVSEIERLATDFRTDLIPALSLLGLVLMAGFGFQIAAGLKPLDSLRASVNKVRYGKEARLDTAVPQEIQPLVEEVNSLLALQEKSMTRARDRAADLAHGLKTPLTALVTDIARLRAKNEVQIADDIEDLAFRMQRLMERELAQARIRHGRSGHKTSVDATAEAVIRTLQRTPRGEKINISQNIPTPVNVAMDQDDLNEVLGNLLDNAVRHARFSVIVSVASSSGRARVSIEDDGEGVSAEQSAAIMQRGQRMDVKGTGAGLGLAIVQDILEASNASISLSKSAMGGLRVTLELPLSEQLTTT